MYGKTRYESPVYQEIAVQALKDSFIKIEPGSSGEKSGYFHCRHWSTYDDSGCIFDIFNSHFSNFNLQITLWALVYCIVCNFAEQ